MPKIPENEIAVQGAAWDALHGGWFARAAPARKLLQAARERARESGAQVVADLGGGTGFLLQRLRRGWGPGEKPELLELECSPAQAAEASRRGVRCVLGSVESFARGDLGAPEKKFLFLMRSVLHYAGHDGLAPLLRRLREQARAGEYFVHQSASFRLPEEAERFNSLYSLLGTGKWYPTVIGMREALAESGWETLETLPAPSLPLRSAELAARYRIAPAEMAGIVSALRGRFPAGRRVFVWEKEGFRAYLRYRIYVCRASRNFCT